MNNIQLWDDLDYMIDEMRIKPYDWNTSGDFPAVKIDPYWKNLGTAVVKRNEESKRYQQKYLCPKKHECYKANKEEMKGYIYCNNCYSENPIIHGVKGMYYPINSDKVTKL